MYEWEQRAGVLSLFPSYGQSLSVHAGHLVFCWRDRGENRLVSLHAWKPLEQATQTLRRVVESIPARD